MFPLAWLATCAAPLLLLARQIVDHVARIAAFLFLRCVEVSLWHFLLVLPAVSVCLGYGGRILAATSPPFVLSASIVLFPTRKYRGRRLRFSIAFLSPFRNCDGAALSPACRRIYISGGVSCLLVL